MKAHTMFKIGTIVTPIVDSGIAAARVRYTARVVETDGTTMRIEDARRVDINGDSHGLPLGPTGMGDWVNPGMFRDISTSRIHTQSVEDFDAPLSPGATVTLRTAPDTDSPDREPK